ncbi:methyltransferase domain-containing protein [Streptomyces sp. NPDC057555]|uniref:DNA topoisomerase (ATP-hydrolyzing) n=1 Tax=Streptomyces sp. JCM 9888 TaxID=1570103 RepID=A0A0B5H312_9ACTN|nr:DNA topoisomerase II [Streptomyces sp. JCM 9888]
MTGISGEPGAPASYDARSIIRYSGLEAVRRTPGMYIGSAGSEGLHQLVNELIDNAVDEAESGHCTRIAVVLHADGSCSVTDDGRGIPVDIHPDTGRPACELVLTTLHSGGKFEGDQYTASAGLHGVGLACVNALSDWLRLEVARDGSCFRQTFARGASTSDLTRLGEATWQGTRVRFQPDVSVLDTGCLDAETVIQRLQEIAFLHPGLEVRFEDERDGRTLTLQDESGVAGLLELRTADAELVHDLPIRVTGEHDGVSLDVAFRWTEGYAEELWGYVNGVRTHQGGDHIDGFRTTLASVINDYATHRGMLTSLGGESVTAVDVLEGLTAVLTVRMARPRFDGQTKRRLQSPEAGTAVRTLTAGTFAGLLKDDEKLAGAIVQRALDATRARLAARLAGRATRVRRRETQVDYAAYKRQFGIRSRNWHDSCAWLADEELLAQHAQLCDVPPDAKMLDVCCGSGVVGHAFKGRVGEMVGLDITPEMVRLAQNRLDRVDQGNVYDLPYEDESFDIVVNREVLHLLPGPERPVSEIYRVLRPGGQFIVGQIMPYDDLDAYWMFRIFKKKQPLLFQMFREKDFRSLLLGAGFEQLRMEEHFLWESIDRWIDTHETTPAHRQEIYRLYYDAPREVREVHPFEVGTDGSVRDRWRWCIYSVRKPAC